MRTTATLDAQKIGIIVLFSILAIICARGFLHYYFFAPARAAEMVRHHLETVRARGPQPGTPVLPPPPAHSALYERWWHGQQYLRTGDEQAKRWVIRDEKRRQRGKHWLAIWGSLAGICVSIAVIVSVVRPLVRERRA